MDNGSLYNVCISDENSAFYYSNGKTVFLFENLKNLIQGILTLITNETSKRKNII